MNKASLATYIQKLRKNGLIERVDHGKYKLTEKGINEAKNLNEIFSVIPNLEYSTEF